VLYVMLTGEADGARAGARKWADGVLERISDHGATGGPDRDTWGLLPHQVAAQERAMRLTGGEG
jgi:hypothetical protein